MSTLYKRVAEELMEAGYERKSTSGSHRKWSKPDRPSITLSICLTDRNLANRILKIAGIDKKL